MEWSGEKKCTLHFVCPSLYPFLTFLSQYVQSHVFLASELTTFSVFHTGKGSGVVTVLNHTALKTEHYTVQL